jgi:hypothetical protein
MSFSDVSPFLSSTSHYVPRFFGTAAYLFAADWIAG